MPDRFGLPEKNVRRILNWVHILQTSIMFVLGALLVSVPRSRFGHSYDLLLAIPGGPRIIGAAYLAIACAMVLAIDGSRTHLMGLALTAGGINNWTFGAFLLGGAVTGPTGALGAPFCFYLGAHMLLQSILFNAENKKPRAQ